MVKIIYRSDYFVNRLSLVSGHTVIDETEINSSIAIEILFSDRVAINQYAKLCMMKCFKYTPVNKNGATNDQRISFNGFNINMF